MPRYNPDSQFSSDNPGLPRATNNQPPPWQNANQNSQLMPGYGSGVVDPGMGKVINNTDPNNNPFGPGSQWTPATGDPNQPGYDPGHWSMPGGGWSPTGSSPAGPAGGGNVQMPQGIDPRLAQLYQQAGLTPGARGSGFADWQYWQDLMDSAGADYALGRLQADLAGTGSDSASGTPGQGAWDRSGGGVASAGQAGGGGMGGFNVPGSSAALARYQPMSDQLMQFITGRGTGQITDASIPNLQVSPTDPIIKGQTDAYRAEQERGVRTALSRAAESNAGGAIPGAQDATARSLEEQAGQATSGYEATLMSQELNSRRQELQQALSGALGFMTSEQQIAAQDELARVEAALQESQFSRNLAERGLEFGANLDLQYAGL